MITILAYFKLSHLNEKKNTYDSTSIEGSSSVQTGCGVGFVALGLCLTAFFL